MTEAEAIVDTANATWALVYATVFLAVLTLLVVIAAVGVPLWQRDGDKSDKTAQIVELDAQAEAAVQKTVDLVREVEGVLAQAYEFDQFQLWPLSNRLQTQKRVVNYFFTPGGVSPSVPYRLSASLRALDETADAVQRALDKQGPITPEHKANMRKMGAETAQRALEQLTAALNPIP